MDIRNRNELKDRAAYALRRGREPKKLIAAYAIILTATAAVITLLNIWLDRQIAGTGGLSSIGTRTILSTAQTILPIVQTVLLLSIEFGYLYGMLRIARGQYADHTDLKSGFRYFGPVLRLNILQGLIFSGIAFATMYLAMQIFLFTPWAEPVMELLMPIASSADPVLDAATSLQAGKLMIPMFILFGVLYFAISMPLTYYFRMANYVLLDAPRAGAIAALRESRRMMHGNCIHLLKLDLSFWWFYLLDVLVSLLCYGDVLLPMIGIELPIDSKISYYMFYVLYLAGTFALTWFFRNPVETTYIMAYESIHGRKEDSGVVLGNIFDM